MLMIPYFSHSRTGQQTTMLCTQLRECAGTNSQQTLCTRLVGNLTYTLQHNSLCNVTAVCIYCLSLVTACQPIYVDCPSFVTARARNKHPHAGRAATRRPHARSSQSHCLATHHRRVTTCVPAHPCQSGTGRSGLHPARLASGATSPRSPLLRRPECGFRSRICCRLWPHP